MATDAAFIIKVCGITSIEDAEAAVESGANALGFNFYERSPRYLTPEKARGIIHAVTRPYLKVGVFVNASGAEITAVADEVGLDVLQVYGSDWMLPASNRYRIWQSVPAGSAVPAHHASVEAYLLDSATPNFGGSGQAFDWNLTEGFPHPFVLAGGLDGSNVAQAIATTRPWGVDACSRLEKQPGVKDPSKVRYFVTAAQRALLEILNLQEVNV